jgi:hypothetical protein
LFYSLQTTLVKTSKTLDFRTPPANKQPLPVSNALREKFLSPAKAQSPQRGAARKRWTAAAAFNYH